MAEENKTPKRKGRPPKQKLTVNGNPKRTGTKTKQVQHGYTLEDLVAILDKCIPIYRQTNRISFHAVLENNCTYTQTNWDYWLLEKKTPEIIERFKILRDIQKEKTISGAMDGTYNPAFSMFLLKCKYGWIEENHKQSLEISRENLELQKKKADTITDILGSDKDINITFS